MSRQQTTPEKDPFDPSKNFDSYNPLQHLTADKLIRDWSALKTAIQAGSDEYLRTKKSDLAGFFHGDTGRYRAQNLKKWTDTAEENTFLFALLYAIFSPDTKLFESRSSGLAMCIAQKLIQGDFSYSTDYGSASFHSKNTLTSPVFSENALKCSTTDHGALNIFSTESISIGTYNTRGAVRTFLAHARDNMSEAEKVYLDSQVASLKHRLVTKPSADFEEMRTVAVAAPAEYEPHQP